MSWWKIWERSVPQSTLPQSKSNQSEPVTSRGLGGALVTGRPKAFDPALKHFSSGVVPGDPRFDAPDELAEWRKLQRRVMAHVLRAIAESPCSRDLVLRGSALMCAWFGEAARPPKDLDFVVIPESFGIRDVRAAAMFEAIVAAVIARPCPGVELRREEVALDDIWTYERAPGNRLVFRWSADGMPWGVTQLDFVFGERMLEPPELLSVKLDDGPAAKLQAAPKSLSLAWKLLWLHSDWHPRGKDLYDTMLLAESTRVPLDLVEAVFKLAGENVRVPEHLDDFYGNGFEWIGFEEPDAATFEAWKARLRTALRPS